MTTPPGVSGSRSSVPKPVNSPPEAAPGTSLTGVETWWIRSTTWASRRTISVTPPGSATWNPASDSANHEIPRSSSPSQM